MALAEDTVREALKQVIDPELYVNIVDLGLIYVVNISEADADGKHEVNIEMTMTSPMCPAVVRKHQYSCCTFYCKELHFRLAVGQS